MNLNSPLGKQCGEIFQFVWGGGAQYNSKDEVMDKMRQYCEQSGEASVPKKQLDEFCEQLFQAAEGMTPAQLATAGQIVSTMQVTPIPVQLHTAADVGVGERNPPSDMDVNCPRPDKMGEQMYNFVMQGGVPNTKDEFVRKMRQYYDLSGISMPTNQFNQMCDNLFHQTIKDMTPEQRVAVDRLASVGGERNQAPQSLPSSYSADCIGCKLRSVLDKREKFDVRKRANPFPLLNAKDFGQDPYTTRICGATPGSDVCLFTYYLAEIAEQSSIATSKQLLAATTKLFDRVKSFTKVEMWMLVPLSSLCINLLISRQQTELLKILVKKMVEKGFKINTPERPEFPMLTLTLVMDNLFQGVLWKDYYLRDYQGSEKVIETVLDSLIAHGGDPETLVSGEFIQEAIRCLDQNKNAISRYLVYPANALSTRERAPLIAWLRVIHISDAVFNPLLKHVKSALNFLNPCAPLLWSGFTRKVDERKSRFQAVAARFFTLRKTLDAEGEKRLSCRFGEVLQGAVRVWFNSDISGPAFGKEVLSWLRDEYSDLLLLDKESRLPGLLIMAQNPQCGQCISSLLRNQISTLENHPASFQMSKIAISLALRLGLCSNKRFDQIIFRHSSKFNLEEWNRELSQDVRREIRKLIRAVATTCLQWDSEGQVLTPDLDLTRILYKVEKEGLAQNRRSPFPTVEVQEPVLRWLAQPLGWISVTAGSSAREEGNLWLFFNREFCDRLTSDDSTHQDNRSALVFRLLTEELYPADHLRTKYENFAIKLSFRAVFEDYLPQPEPLPETEHRTTLFRWLCFLEGILTGFSLRKFIECLAKTSDLSTLVIEGEWNKINGQHLLDEMPSGQEFLKLFRSPKTGRLPKGKLNLLLYLEKTSYFTSLPLDVLGPYHIPKEEWERADSLSSSKRPSFLSGGALKLTPNIADLIAELKYL